MEQSINIIEFATKAHKGQYRRDGITEYIQHPIHVASILKCFTDDFNLIYAGYLHDVLEDTLVSKSEIIEIANQDICNLVVEVTSIAKKSDGNRKTRKLIDNEYLSSISERGQILKLADIYSNLSDINYDTDHDFKHLYFSEKKETLVYLTKVSNHPLFYMVSKLINDYFDQILIPSTVSNP